MESDVKKEAELFSRYLIGRSPDELSVSLYARAMNTHGISLDREDKKILQFIMRNNWALPLADAGLCMFRRNSQVRKKIFIMLAILEASPLYCDQFLPAKRNSFYTLYIIWTGLRAFVKAVMGGLLLKFI